MNQPFRTIVADPPWAFSDKLPGKSRGAVKNYSIMDIDDIGSFLRDQKIAVANDARLFLWRVASMQSEALFVVATWGFTLKSEIVWVKMSREGSTKLHFGMGRQVRNSHETCLIGVKGKPERLSRSVRSVLFAPYERHSQKPESFYDLVEQLSPRPYLELFARRQRKGWTCLGYELT